MNRSPLCRNAVQAAALLASSLFLGGCVGQGTYDAAVADLNDARAANAACVKDRARVRRDLDDAKLAADRLRDTMDRQGAEAFAISRERTELRAELDEQRAALDELRRQHAAANARAALMRDVAKKLQGMIDAGLANVSLREGRMVIQLSNDVLFDSGRTDIKPAGRDALVRVAGVLKSIDKRHFQVAGHTDDVPIHTARFPSNWELSTARGVEVVRFLVEHGVAAATLSAAGYGELDPIAPNTLAEGRARNRRIEITVVPNIDELVRIPE